MMWKRLAITKLVNNQ